MDIFQAELGRRGLPRFSSVMLAMTIVAGASWNAARADILIPTNAGGADAEVREEEFNFGGTGVPQGTNRGASTHGSLPRESRMPRATRRATAPARST